MIFDRDKWLTSVNQRTDLQRVMLEIHKFLEDSASPNLRVEEEDIAALLCGAAFGLWRTAFLIPEANERDSNNVRLTGKKFLEGIVRTQTITYNFDLDQCNWAAGYYVNDAHYRMIEIRACFNRIDPKLVSSTQDLRNLSQFTESADNLSDSWTLLFGALKESLELAMKCDKQRTKQ